MRRRRVVNVREVLDSIDERRPWQVVELIVEVFGDLESHSIRDVVRLSQTEHVTNKLSSCSHRQLLHGLQFSG